MRVNLIFFFLFLAVEFGEWRVHQNDRMLRKHIHDTASLEQNVGLHVSMRLQNLKSGRWPLGAYTRGTRECLERYRNDLAGASSDRLVRSHREDLGLHERQVFAHSRRPHKFGEEFALADARTSGERIGRHDRSRVESQQFRVHSNHSRPHKLDRGYGEFSRWAAFR